MAGVGGSWRVLAGVVGVWRVLFVLTVFVVPAALRLVPELWGLLCWGGGVSVPVRVCGVAVMLLWSYVETRGWGMCVVWVCVCV